MIWGTLCNHIKWSFHPLNTWSSFLTNNFEPRRMIGLLFFNPHLPNPGWDGVQSMQCISNKYKSLSDSNSRVEWVQIQQQKKNKRKSKCTKGKCSNVFWYEHVSNCVSYRVLGTVPEKYECQVSDRPHDRDCPHLLRVPMQKSKHKIPKCKNEFKFKSENPWAYKH